MKSCTTCNSHVVMSVASILLFRQDHTSRDHFLSMIVQLRFQSEVDSSHDDESRGDFLSGKRESSIDSLMTVPDDLHWSDGGKSLGPSGLIGMIQLGT